MKAPVSNECREMLEPGLREREAAAIELFRAAIPLRQHAGVLILDHRADEAHLRSVLAVDFYREAAPR